MLHTCSESQERTTQAVACCPGADSNWSPDCQIVCAQTGLASEVSSSRSSAASFALQQERSPSSSFNLASQPRPCPSPSTGLDDAGTYMQQLRCKQEASRLTLRPMQHLVGDQWRSYAVVRARVIDSLTAVGFNLGLTTDALFLAVACFDRCSCSTTCCKGDGCCCLAPELLHPEQVYLVGLACLWTAVKYEDGSAPTAQQLVISSAMGFSTQQLVAMEERVLRQLGYSFALPTAKSFLRIIMQNHSTIAPVPATLYHMAAYLTEISLMEYSLTTSSPSRVAAAAYSFAHALLNAPLPASALPTLVGHSVLEVSSEMKWLCMLHATLTKAAIEGNPYNTTRKYFRAEYGQVARVPALQTA